MYLNGRKTAQTSYGALLQEPAIKYKAHKPQFPEGRRYNLCLIQEEQDIYIVCRYQYHTRYSPSVNKVNKKVLPKAAQEDLCNTTTTTCALVTTAAQIYKTVRDIRYRR